MPKMHAARGVPRRRSRRRASRTAAAAATTAATLASLSAALSTLATGITTALWHSYLHASRRRGRFLRRGGRWLLTEQRLGKDRRQEQRPGGKEGKTMTH